MTPEQMDEHGRSHGMTFVSAGNNGSRTYRRPHMDGFRTTYLILEADGREFFFKAMPPSPESPADDDLSSDSSAGIDFREHPQASGTSAIPAPPAQRNRLLRWLATLLLWLPLSLIGLTGSSYGLHSAYTQWQTITHGTYIEARATSIKMVTRQGGSTLQGSIRLPNGNLAQTPVDSIATPIVHGWHLGNNFIRDTHAQRWIVPGGGSALLLLASILLLVRTLSSIRSLVRGT
jgi:hypothetical protein